MSAIFGIIDLLGRPLEDSWIKSMQIDLAHRGPDGQGLYWEESVALGHMLLKVTPESIYDKSPYEEDGFVITAHARLDEREEIMDRLGIELAERDKITDPLLLLRSFRKYGKNFVKDIYGDFSFAIWDKQKRELFCARDQMGVKPFLYYFYEGKFVFSSELKSIVRLPFVQTRINYKLLRDQAYNIWDKPKLTTWDNIFRLLSAHTLRLKIDSLFLEKYWVPEYRKNMRFRTLATSSEHLKKLLSRIINDHSRGVENIGIPLSGGLDSGTIASIAKEMCKESGKKIFTVSSVLDPEKRKTEIDETEYINEILNKSEINSQFVYSSEFNFHRNLNSKFERNYAVVNALHYFDEAIFTKFSNVNTSRVLSGIPGDFTATNRFINPYPRLLLEGRFVAIFNLFIKEKKLTNQTLFKFIYHIFSPLIPLVLKTLLRKLNGQREVISLKELFLIPKAEDRKEISKKILNTAKINILRQYRLIYDLWPSGEFFNEEWDTESSYYNIEITYPLADRRLIEFLLQVPVEHFRAGGSRRGFIKEAMKGVLPEKIRLRNDKLTCSPDYHAIFKNNEDFNKIFKEPTLAPVQSLLNTSEFSKELNNLLNSEKSCCFTGNYWNVIEIYLWLAFVHSFYKQDGKNNKQDGKKSKKELE